MRAIPVYLYPHDMCETCIRQLEDLVDSGEYSEVNEILEDLKFNGFTCQDCIQLENGSN